jgi:uncharacterized protein YggE
MNPRSLSKILIALAALALLAPASGAAQGRTVAATGEATLRVANDTAGVGFSVSRERRSRGAALQAVSAGLRNVIAATEQVPGVGAGDVSTGRVSVRAVHRGKRTVYRAAEGIAVTLHQPKRAGDLVDAAIGAGASGVSGPRFFVGDTEAAFRRALAAAFDAAKAQAGTLASQAGGTLGAAISVDEGDGAELFSAGFVDDKSEGEGPPADNAAPVPTRPGHSTVTATVHAVFELL